MTTSPLLSNVRHSAMIVPISPLSTRLTHINPSCWKIFMRLKLFKIRTVHGIGFQIQCSLQIHCFTKHSVRYELYLKKYLTA